MLSPLIVVLVILSSGVFAAEGPCELRFKMLRFLLKVMQSCMGTQKTFVCLFCSFRLGVGTAFFFSFNNSIRAVASVPGDE